MMKLSILRHNMAIVCTVGLSPCALGNTPALSIDRCLLWSYTEVMKKEKMITPPDRLADEEEKNKKVPKFVDKNH